MTTQTTALLARRAAFADWLRRLDPWTATALAVVLVAALAGLWQVRPAAPVTPAATLAPVLVMVTQQPPTADTIAVASAELRLPRAVVAYDQPSGRPLGAIDSGRAYEVLARSGLGWMQLRIDGSGDIWARRVEVEGEVLDMATPQPTEQPIVVYVAPPAAIATPAPEPTAAPQPAIRVGGCSVIEAAAKCSRTLPQR